ncbi:LysR family transcriptional regulator [Actibacterium pelagium]|uniref:LysR family transcriptional regulator n=1 Tax=Actibacterium pelagium TaxID=2029103 RepID=A0A917EIL2_9RHOB|nr:LysR family transcriptional regulator [Actibacterium pelagium]
MRTPEGLSPTPRAVALAGTVARLLHETEESIIKPDAFDPHTAEAHFVVGAPDRISLPVFLPLMRRLGQIAPKVGLQLRTTDRDYAIRLIEGGDIALALGWFEQTPPHIERLLAFEDVFVCLCRSDHPLLAGSKMPTLTDILEYGHLVVSSTGDQRAVFDTVLERHGLTRTIAATVMNFTIVPELLLGSDLIGVFTHLTADYLTQRYPLTIAPVPLEVAPVANHLIWHRRFNEDPAHKWLREELRLAWKGSKFLPSQL